MQRIAKSIAASAEEWGISPRVAWIIALLPIMGAALVLMSYASRPLYRFIVKEDGPVEWAQFLCYAAVCLFSIGIAYKRFKAGHPWQALMFAGFAFVNLFIAGEEIAWGQRIFGLQTPDDLKAINAQGEITIHNIGHIQDIFNFIMFLAAGYGVVAYFANQRVRLERYWDQARHLLVPALFLVPTFLVAFAYKLIRYTVVRSPGFTVTKYAEVAELCLAFGFLVFTALNYRLLATQTVQLPVIQEAKLGDKTA
ncbi:MAG: hypothetical protein ABIV47_11905 [Roseiflexaceae bacterium]